MSVLKTAAIHPPPSPAACPVFLRVGSRVQWGGSVLPLQQQRAACGRPARVWVREDPVPAPRLLGHATVPPWVSFPHLPVEAHDSPGTLGLCWNVPLVWGNLFKSERGESCIYRIRPWCHLNFWYFVHVAFWLYFRCFKSCINVSPTLLTEFFVTSYVMHLYLFIF